MMTRLCIFVTYDCENIVEDYIACILNELRKVTDTLVVVCNYEYVIGGVDNLQKYADKIFFRKNKGFDAGAYKDAICQYIGFDEIRKYDEMVLVNDSFYGPFYSFENLFYEMDSADVDYWGLIRAPSGMFDNKYSYNSHIQSYFLALRKSVLCDYGFQQFWKKLKYPGSMDQTVMEFELGFNKYLSGQGFKSMALTDMFPECQFKYNEIPYLLYSYELIKNAKFPVLKRKSLDFGSVGFGNALEAFRYIEEQNGYDVNLIKKHLSRIGRLKECRNRFNYKGLEQFYYAHDRIYFYGAGVYGKNLAKFFEYKGWSFQGYFVSNMSDLAENCTIYSDAEIKQEDGIIIAVKSYDMFLEIWKSVEKRCSAEQIFSPNYIITDK